MDIFKKCAAQTQSYAASLARSLVPPNDGSGAERELGSVCYPRELYRDYGVIEANDLKEYIRLSNESIAHEDAACGSIPRYLLAAENGMGKTYLCALLALAYMRHDEAFFENCGGILTDGDVFPVLCDLSLLPQEDGALDAPFTETLYAAARSVPKGDITCAEFTGYLLERSRNGSALLIIDSLDQLSPGELGLFTEKLGSFLDEYPKARVFIAGRSYDSRFLDLGFMRVGLRGIESFKDLMRFSNIWFTAFYGGGEKAKSESEGFVREIRVNPLSDKSGLVYCPLYLAYYIQNYAVRRTNRDSFDSELVMKLLDRYTRRRGVTLGLSAAAVLLEYIAAEFELCGKPISRERLLDVIEEAAGEGNSLTPEQLADELIRNEMLGEYGGGYCPGFIREVRLSLFASSFKNGHIPRKFEDPEGFLLDNITLRPELTTAAASVSQAYAGAAFSEIKYKLEKPVTDIAGEKERSVLEFVRLSLLTTPGTGLKLSERSLQAICDEQFETVSIANLCDLVRFLGDGILRRERVIEIIKRGFRACIDKEREAIDDKNSDFHSGYRYSLAMIEIYESNSDGISAINERLVQLARGDTYGQALALSITVVLGFLLPVGALPNGGDHVTLEELAGFGCTDLRQHKEAAEEICRLIVSYPIRSIAADAARELLGSGMLRRGDFPDDDELLSLLDDGRDPAAETLLCFSDILSAPLRRIPRPEIARRHLELYRSAKSADARYRFFKLSVVAGCEMAAYEMFTTAISLEKELREAYDTHEIPGTGYLAYLQGTNALAPSFDNGMDFIVVFDHKDIEDPKLSKIVKGGTADGLSIIFMSELMRKGVIKRCLLVEDDWIFELNTCSVLERTTLLEKKNNFALINYILALWQKCPMPVNEAAKLLENLLTMGDAPRQPLGGDIEEYYERQLYKNDADAVYAFVLLALVYRDEYKPKMFTAYLADICMRNNGFESQLRERITGLLQNGV